MDETTKWILIAAVVIVGLIILKINLVINEKNEKIVGLTKLISDRDIRINDFENMVKTFNTNLQNNAKNYDYQIKQHQAELDKKLAEEKVKLQQWALLEFDKFKAKEIEGIKKQSDENAIKAAANLLQQWKAENEGKIRQDAANRSYSVLLGQVTEHLIPFHTKFPFNPKDARFIGSPIDLIVFDGISDDEDEVNIYFVEIKTGKSVFSSKQKKIKSAVENKRVIWFPVNSNDL